MPTRSSISQLVASELKQFTTINPAKRPWHLPFTFAFAVSMPVLMGVYYGRLDKGHYAPNFNAWNNGFLINL